MRQPRDRLPPTEVAQDAPIDDPSVHTERKPMPEQILRVTRDSIFKRRPVSPDTLPDSDKQVVLAGRTFSLHHCAYDDANGTFACHIKIALKAPEAFIGGINTWFVCDRHAQVEPDSDSAYPKPTTTVRPLPIATRNTTFKQRPSPASQLSPT